MASRKINHIHSIDKENAISIFSNLENVFRVFDFLRECRFLLQGSNKEEKQCKAFLPTISNGAAAGNKLMSKDVNEGKRIWKS